MGKDSVQVSPDMACDEGGVHKFQVEKEAGCCDYFSCFFCWPCYILCSCAMSEGAAFANPLFEQMCGEKGRDDQNSGSEPSCKKCGLTQREASDLAAARQSEAEAGRRKTGYFSTAMNMPSAQGAGPR